MALSNNTFCWNGLISSDPAKTLAFFPEVLGWQRQTIEMDGETVEMLANDNEPLAHVRGPAAAGEPSWWNNYFRVDDVDAVAKKAAAAGGKILVEPTDIGPGRFATIATPSGASLSLFHERNPEDKDAEVKAGNIHWVDLHSKDIEADLGFIRDGLGLKTNEMPMPNGPYHILEPDSATRAGAMTGQNPNAPSMWLAWVQVEDVDGALDRVGRHGGQVLAPAWDAEGIGRMVIASDPVGVVFGLIRSPAAN